MGTVFVTLMSCGKAAFHRQTRALNVFRLLQFGPHSFALQGFVVVQSAPPPADPGSPVKERLSKAGGRRLQTLFAMRIRFKLGGTESDHVATSNCLSLVPYQDQVV